MRVALRRPDGHSGARGDLVERPVESVLEHDDARLLGRDRSQLGGELGAELRESERAGRVGVLSPTRRSSSSGSQRRARWRAARVAAGVDDEPVEPGRRTATRRGTGGRRVQSLASASCAASTSVRSRRSGAGSALDPRRVALAQCGQRGRVAVERSPVTRIGSLRCLVGERPSGRSTTSEGAGAAGVACPECIARQRRSGIDAACRSGLRPVDDHRRDVRPGGRARPLRPSQ